MIDRSSYWFPVLPGEDRLHRVIETISPWPFRVQDTLLPDSVETDVPYYVRFSRKSNDAYQKSEPRCLSQLRLTWPYLPSRVLGTPFTFSLSTLIRYQSKEYLLPAICPELNLDQTATTHWYPCNIIPENPKDRQKTCFLPQMDTDNYMDTRRCFSLSCCEVDGCGQHKSYDFTGRSGMLDVFTSSLIRFT